MNKKGGVTVESAMVFPLVILSVTALISLMSYFYLQLSERVDMHMMLRSECGTLCENMFYGNQNANDFPVYKKTQQLYSEDVICIGKKGIFRAREKSISARKYLIDEVRFIRMTCGAEDVISDYEE